MSGFFCMNASLLFALPFQQRGLFASAFRCAKTCTACSKSRTIKIHPEKSQSSDLEGKQRSLFQIVQPHPFVIRINKVRMRVSYLQMNQLLSKGKQNAVKRNTMQPWTYYLREKSVLRCLFEKQLNAFFYCIELTQSLFWLTWLRSTVL